MQVKRIYNVTKVAVQMALLSVFATQVVAQTLPAPDYSGPAIEPSYPAAFQDIDLSIMSSDTAAASGTPEIAEWTRINKPGDSMMVVGHRLSGRSGDEYGRDTSFHFFPSSAAGQLADGRILRLVDGKTTVTLPDNLEANSVYLMWPRNEDGYGTPVSINQAEAWWAAPRSVAVDEVFSVFGRNMVRNEAAPVSYIYIESPSGSGQWLTSLSANPYKAEFKFPNGLANGEYTFWAHNGSGKRAGWSEPISINVRTKHGWSDDRSTWINVKTDFGAAGNGSANDYQAIANALSKAKSGTYETVYFPAGTYAVSEKINVFGDMRIIGDGMDQTTITSHSSYGGQNSYGLFMMGGNKGPTEFHDMTFSSGKYLTQGLMDKIAQYRGAENMLFKNIRFDYLEHDQSENSEVINIDRSKNIIFDGCEFILTGALSLAYADEILIKNCDFYGINDIGYMISMSAADKVSVEDCTAQHYDSSDLNDGHGWSQGRFLNGSGSNGGIHDVYFGGNRMYDMMVRPGYYNQNTGEKFMTEHGHTVFRDKPSAVTANTITLSSLSEDFTGETVVVAGGKGLGQNRKIVGFSNGKITLDRPWRVMPDSSSIIMVGEYMNRHVVYDNYFDGIPLATESDGTATTGVEPFGAQLNMIVDNNDFHELRKGISNWSMPSPVQGSAVSLQPNYFNMFMNNRFDKCRYGIENAIAIWNYKPTVWDTTMLGNVWRGNDIQNTVKEAVRYFTWQTDDTRIDMCVFDQNKADNVGDSVADGEDLKNQVWVSNVFNGIKSDSAITFSGGHVPVLHGNTWNGYSSSKYGGDRPGGVLEIPYRSVLMGNADAQLEVPVLNGGTDEMTWNATSSEAWLKLDSDSGSVSDENDFDKLTMSVDETQPSFGQGSSAIVTISSGDQVKQMTVTYSEGAVSPPPPEKPPAPVLTGIRIEGSSSMDEETSANYICVGSYSDGTSETISGEWSLDSDHASINGQGVVLAGNITQDEVITLSASAEEYTATKDVTLKFVPPTVSVIEISGPTALDEESSAQYTCFAHYSDGTVLSVNPVWSTSSTDASIDSNGQLTADDVVADQQVTLSASFGGKVGSYAVNIRYLAPTLSGITIVGSLAMDEGTTEQFGCVGSYSDGTTAVVTPTWSENSSYATISASGLLNAGDVGANQVVVVSATLGGFNANQSVSINYVAPFVTTLELSGPSTVQEESAAQYSCEAVYSDGTRVAVTPSWSVSGNGSISASGNFSSGNVTADSTATIQASYDGKSGSLDVTVAYVAPDATGISISGPLNVEEGLSAAYTCTATYSDGTTGLVSPVWSMSSAFAAVNSSGQLQAGDVAENQTVVLVADYAGLSSSYSVEVRYVAPPVAITGVSITAPVSVSENGSVQLLCSAVYSDGSSSVIDPIWSVIGSAEVDADGLLTAGNVDEDEVLTITASHAGFEGSVTINLWSMGNRIIYPLSGFEGKTVKGRLFDKAAQTWHDLGEMEAPEELVIENVIEDQWYWVSIEEYDDELNYWVVIHGNWVSM